MPPAAIHAAAPAPVLASLQGRERVVLIFASSPHDARADAQARDLGRARGGLKERDLRIVLVEGGAVAGLADAAVALRHRFGVGDDAFAVILVGKDGNVARHSAEPVAAADLFAQIDAMPMRRDEIRQRGR